MKFMSAWTISPENRDKAIARFKESGGKPPQGVKMLGRWHSVGGNAGFVLGETDDPVAMHRWVNDWSDLMSFTTVAVIDDEEFMQSFR
jgi:hypothetical protein